MAGTGDHDYKVRVEWTGNTGSGTSGYREYARSHEIFIDGKPVIHGSSDPAFRGEPGRHNPEELLVASLSACHMLWYLHLCADARIVVTEYHDAARGVMRADEGGGGRFTSVTLQPRVTVEPGSDVDLAHALHGRAHELCFIARSVNFPVTCTPVVVATAERIPGPA